MRQNKRMPEFILLHYFPSYLFLLFLSENENKVKWDLTPASSIIDPLLKWHNIMFQNRQIHVRTLHPSPKSCEQSKLFQK